MVITMNIEVKKLLSFFLAFIITVSSFLPVIVTDTNAAEKTSANQADFIFLSSNR